MARINLLPWREELRKEKLRGFMVTAMLFAALGVVGGVSAYVLVHSQVLDQEEKNQRLNDEIVKLDKKIQEIETLEEKKSALLARMEAIERLQIDRPTVVRLFDELQSTLPEGASYTSVEQVGYLLTIEGLAESEARVSSFMRRLERSQLFEKPVLTYIRVRGTDRDGFGVRINEFKLTVRQVTPRSSSEDEGLHGDTI